MQSKGKRLTASQKRWYDAVANLGSVISGGPAVLHHPIGQRGKHNKKACGVWWIVPLTDDEHKRLHAGEPIWNDVVGEEMPVHSRKQFEKWAFKWYVVEDLAAEGLLPEEYDFEINHAIMDYHL